MMALPALIQELETKFGSMIWEPRWNRQYRTRPEDVNDLFDIYNKHVFGGKLVKPMRLLIKRTQAPILGGFVFGLHKGVPVHLELYNITYTSFFQLMNTVAHELIHYYDWLTGPLAKLYDIYGRINVTPDGISTYNPGHPTQVAHSWRYPDYKQAMAANDRVYDMHGRWFWVNAEKFNSKGFDIKDIYIPSQANPSLRRVDEDPDETPLALRHLNDDNPIRHMYNMIKDIEYKDITYIDENNWFITIT